MRNALLAMIFVAINGYAQDFTAATISADESTLVLRRAGGEAVLAPKFEDQDQFRRAAVAPDGGTVGWLALYPGRSGSYSQPLSLVVLDRSNRIQRFQGAFGMVYEWCFTDAGASVTFMYSFPHGVTPVGFDKRRLRDGKLLARTQLDPIPAGEHEGDILRRRAPAWAKCAVWPAPRR